VTNDDRDILLIEMAADVKTLKRLVEDHHAVLYGNGHAGVKADLNTILQAHANCPAREALSLGGRGLKQQALGNSMALVALVVSAVTATVSLAGPVGRWLATIGTP
jgi:hypothetical protein